MNISGLFRIIFFHYKGYILREFQSFAFKSQWIESEWKKDLFQCFLFFFYWIKSILMFHLSFYRYFEYLHFLYQIFSHITQYLSFYKRKTSFLQLFDFFFVYFLHKFRVSNIRIFFWWPFETFVKRNADL